MPGKDTGTRKIGTSGNIRAIAPDRTPASGGQALPAGPLVLACVAAFALAGCSLSGLRGVGTPSRQTVSEAPPAPQIVTSEFNEADSTPAGQELAADGAPQPLPQAQPGQPATVAVAQPAPQPQSQPVAQTQPRPPARPAIQPQTSPNTVTTLQSVAPPPLASDRFVPQPEMGDTRDVAIRQMREKAAGANKAPPNVFDIPQSRLQELSPEERESLRRRLEAAADENAASVTEEEALRRQQDTERMLRKARTHYKDALSSIEN